MITAPILITDDYRKTRLARAVPYSYYAAGGWWLPPDPDPESARFALRLFPQLVPQQPELVARARLSAVDHTPIDLATPRWEGLYPNGRPLDQDPWKRVAPLVAAKGWEFMEIQRIDADAAVDALNRGKGYYLGHEMGLGKTLTSCMVMDAWPANFVFIACPSEAKYDPWVQHLQWFMPWMNIVVIGHSAKDRTAAMAKAKCLMDAGQPTAVICHYEAIPLIDGANHRGWKPLGRFDLMIVDEAHVLKGRARKDSKGKKHRTSAQYAAIMRIQAVGHLLLSGSVMSGAAQDLFAPWRLMARKRYSSQWRDWNDRFLEVVEDDYGKVVVGPAVPRLPAFKAELGERLVVRSAKDFLRLPEPRYVHHSLEMTREQHRAYVDLGADYLTTLPDGNIMEVEQGSSLLTGLRRVTGGVAMPDGSWSSAKLDRAMKLVRDAGDSQVLVFGWHKALTEEFQRRCLAAGISCGLVNGNVPKPKRAEAIDLFKRGGHTVLVATIKTLSTAVNLQNASVVVMLEESYDPIDNEQAIGRVHRKGQKAHVSVHYLRIADSVDELEVLPAYMTKAEVRRLVLGSS